MKKSFKVLFLACFVLLLSFPSYGGGRSDAGDGAQTINLVGGTMLPEGHVYWRTVQKFQERMAVNYTGPSRINISLHHSGTLGSERDATEFMIQGVAVDFYIISPAWIATWERTAPIIDAPFLFRDQDHWRRVLEQGVLQPIEENVRNVGLRFLGYGGGSARHLISRVPANTVADFPRIRLRVQGSPVHQRAFSATGFQATPLDYMEVYNAIATGVLDALENEPAGLESMRYYEVAPYYVLTNHQIQTRILAFSERRFQSFPRDVQEAILKSGEEAAAWHRETEIAEAEQQIADMVRNNGLRVIQFDNTEMLRLALPAVEEYAREIGAEHIVRAVQNVR